MTQRSDAPLIRHLTQTYGPETAKDWQRPPLVVLPGLEFRSYLRSHAQEIVEALDVFPQRPWDDVVFDGDDEIRRFRAAWLGYKNWQPEEGEGAERC